MANRSEIGAPVLDRVENERLFWAKIHILWTVKWAGTALFLLSITSIISTSVAVHFTSLFWICRQWEVCNLLQGDPSNQLKPPIALVPTVLAFDRSLLYLPTAQARWRNIPNPSQREDLTIQMGDLVCILGRILSYVSKGQYILYLVDRLYWMMNCCQFSTTGLG